MIGVKFRLQWLPQKMIDSGSFENVSRYAVGFFLFVFLSPAFSALGWVDVTEESLLIPPGGYLDFSRFNGRDPAGHLGRVEIRPSGHFGIAATDSRLRLHCASLALSPATGGFPKGRDAELYARQLKSRGYNVARFHYVEATLMTRRDRDFDFDPVELDAWFYFLAELKKNGIYWVVDGMTSENGAVGGVYPHRWIKKHDLKQRLYFDESARSHWKRLVVELLGRKNPYTGKTTLEDEALIGVITVNEGGINHLVAQKGRWPEGLRDSFNQWLKGKYKDDSSLKKVWGDLAAGESVITGSINLPDKFRERSPRMRDLQSFITQIEVNTGRWMQDYLRGQGYQGAITGFDSWPSKQSDLSRSVFNWIDMHGYHDESFGFSPGTRIEQTSSLENSGRYLRWLAAARQHGKPFSVTEYGQPFWNSYRYEASVMAPAMAALQDWDFVCLHGEGAVDLSLKQSVSRKKAIHPYGVGVDPTTIAGETLAAILLRRGDISPLSRRALIDFSGGGFAGDPVDIIEDDVSLLGWVLRLELDVSKDGRDASGYDLVFDSKGGARGMLGRAISKAPGVLESRVDSTLESLRRSKVISKSNFSNAAGGVFQSENGEVVLDKKAGRFTVATPRTLAFSSNKPLSDFFLPGLHVFSLNSPALFALTSLDDVPLRQSRKILIILAADSQNTGMAFGDASRTVLRDLGVMPPQIKEVSVKFNLTNTVRSAFKLKALALNGQEVGVLPVGQSGEFLNVSLNNSIGGRGVVFFVLEAE